VKIRVNGKAQSNSDVINVVEYFEGFLYSYTKGITPMIEYDIYWSKDPLKDKRIVKDEWVVKDKK